jgi:hypothetical protein
MIAGGTALALLLGFVAYKAWAYERNQRYTLAAENAQMKIEFKNLRDAIVQSSSKVVQSQSDLQANLSKEYKQALLEANQKVLGALSAQIVVAMEKERQGKGTWLSQTEIQFPDPAKRGDEKLMDYFIANLKDPKEPSYRYKLLPQTIQLNGTLNWDEKNGNAPFWLDPQTKTLEGGLQLSIPKSTFTVGPEFVRWVAEMREHKTVETVVMPKYTVELMMGKEFNPLASQSPRTVYGAQGAYNTVSGIGVGLGAFVGGTGGTIVFGKAGWSFGKR